ncbi:MAG: hypothetical protein A2Z27_06410 [candidate division Zixibacteria bacterium RBG_16_50_21]|nr:MAG: hypothetical protein A2Z27_06410 [candidate division Zixibacteria bacterium RBG_16_50_21]
MQSIGDEVAVRMAGSRMRWTAPRIHLISTGLLAATLLLSGLNRSLAQEPVNGLSVYQELKKLELDAGKIAEVQDFTIRKDAATFRLTRGRIYLTRPVQGQVTGAVYIGQGTFEFTPPTEIEKYQLKKFTGDSVLQAKFSELCLRYTDQTLTELVSGLRFVPGQIAWKASDILNNCGQRTLKKLNSNLHARVLEDLLFEGERMGIYSGFFYADIKLEGKERTFFSFDPKQVEEVQLWRENPVMAATAIECDLVCSFHQAGDYKIDPIGQFDEDKDEIIPKQYRMNIMIESSGLMTKECELTLIPKFEGIRVLHFDLDMGVHVSNSQDTSGNKNILIAEKDESGLTVVFPQVLRSAQEEKLVTLDSAKALGRTPFGDFYIKSTEDWFPRYGYMVRSTFDLTFKTPRGHHFLCAGKKVKGWHEKEYYCSQWVEDFPTDIISFNIGNFDVYEKKQEGLPEVGVYWNKQTHQKISQISAEYGQHLYLLGKGMEKNTAADVLNSINFYSSMFGNYPFDHIWVTEIPASHGQAFSGLLHLPFGKFHEEQKFNNELFRSHEVAHQWWGHIVGWKTYHDQWLSEGFAEYCGVWFAQLSTRDNKAFFDSLVHYRDNIVKGHNERQSEGSKAGPLWLGNRLNSSKSFDYYTLNYEKGAYVLHMLRNMMMDLNTRSDEKFIAMLKDFATTYQGKNASTRDFQETVEKHIGADMDWFFNQWVYGIEIPKYKYSYQVEKVENKYQVTLKVGQEKVSPGFKMLVPVVVSYSPGGYSVFRVWVDKPSQTIKLPLVPMQVNEVVFNPYFSVLCEVEEDKR